MAFRNLHVEKVVYCTQKCKQIWT